MSFEELDERMQDLEDRLDNLSLVDNYWDEILSLHDDYAFGVKRLEDKLQCLNYIERMEEKEAYIMKGMDAVYKDICDKYAELVKLVDDIKKDDEGIISSFKEQYRAAKQEIKDTLTRQDYRITRLQTKIYQFEAELEEKKDAI